MIEVVVFTFVFAWFKGYRWKVLNLFKNWSIYPIAFTCLLHIYIIYLMMHGEYWFMEYAKYIKIVSILFYLGLICKYKLFDISIFKKINIKENPILTPFTSPVSLGVLCMGIGSVLNVIAMKFNDSKMPVFASVSFGTGYSKIDMFDKMLQYKDFHIFGSHNTNLIFLTDYIDVFISIMSIGDLLNRVFVVLVIYYSIKVCYHKLINNI